MRPIQTNKRIQGRLLRSLQLYITLAVLLLALPSFAESSPELAAYLKTADQFAELAKEAKARGTVPRRDDPKAAALLNILSDSQRTFGTRTYGKDDLKTLVDVCGAANKAVVVYSLAGLEALKDANATDQMALAAKIRALMIANSHTYQDEMVPLIVFSTHCMARTIPAMTTFMQELPPAQMTDVRRAGLAQTRTGIIQIVLGGIGSQVEMGISEANRRAMLNAVAGNIAAITQALTLPQRANLLQTSLRVEVSAPAEVHDTFDLINAALKDNQCKGLCAL
jgi:hypothetical protein